MEENQTTQTAQTAETAGKATFDQVLADPDYRRAFDERIRAAVSRRFRTVDAQRARIRELAGAMARRLGLESGADGEVDLNALRAALAEEEGDPSSGASRHLPPEGEGLGGSTDEGLPLGGKLSAEPTDEGNAAEVQNGAPDDVDDFRRLMAEGEDLRRLYPGFDLGAELADPRFAALLVSLERAGAPWPVRTAYEAAHHDQILDGALRYAVERTARQVAEGIRSGSARPAENGGGAAADTRPDPRALSPDQRRDIRERVRRGERVTF